MNDNDDNDDDDNNNKHFLLHEEEFRLRNRDDLKMFGWSDWGHIHTKADSPGAGTKIIPDRISVHISNGDFDAISVTERSCAHASPSIKWSVTYRIDFFPSLSLKLLQIFSKVSPKFFKNLRRVTFKCTASVKCHFFFWQLNFLKRKPFKGGEVRCLSPFLKTWFYFQTIDLKPRVVHLKKGIRGGGGGWRTGLNPHVVICYL